MIQESKKNWNYGIQFLQFICCLMIVFRHANPIDSFGLSLGDLKSIVEKFCYHIVQLGTYVTDVAVPVFFIVSGYLYFSKEISVKNYVKGIKIRIRSLVIPYFIWSSFAFLYFVLLTHIPVLARHMHMKTVSLKLNDIFEEIFFSTYAPLWYMRYLFVFVLLGIVLYQLLRNKWTALISIVLLLGYNFIFGYEYFSIITWIPFFLMGGGIRKYCKINEIKKFPIYLLIGLSTILVIIAYFAENNKSGSLLYLYRLISSISLFLLFNYYRENIGDRIGESWKYKTSMFIYGVHRPLVSSVNKVFSLIFGTGAVSAFITNYITIVVIISLLLFVARLLIRFTPKIWKVINGGR